MFSSNTSPSNEQDRKPDLSHGQDEGTTVGSKNPRARRLVLTSGWLLAIAFLIAAWWRASGDLRSGAGPSRIDVGSIASALLILTLAQFLRSFVGWAVAAAFDERIRMRDAYVAWHLSQVAKYLPGGVWMFGARGMLYRRAGLSAPVASAVIALEMIIIVASGAALLLFPVGVSTVGPRWAFVVGGIVGFAMMFVLASPRLWAVAADRRVPGAAEIRERLTSRKGGLVRLLIAPVMLAGVTWVLIGIAFGLLVEGLYGSIGWWSATIIYTTAWVAGFVVIVAPAGIGPREAALTVMLSPTIGPKAALVVALVARLWWMGSEAVHAGVAGLLSFLRPTARGTHRT